MKGKILSLSLAVALIASFVAAAPGAGPTISRVTADYELGMLTIEGTNLDNRTAVSLGAPGGALVPLSLVGVTDTVIVADLPNLSAATYTLILETGANSGNKFAVMVDLAIGAVGPQGPQGERGEKGEKGDQGLQGIQGPQGEKGDKGDQGIQGIQGMKGDKGEKGDRGIQGIQGPKGDKGDQGDRGPQGIQGIQGIQGLQGLTGAAGPAGPRGPAGTPVADWRSTRHSCPGDNRCTATKVCDGKQVIAGGCGHHDWNSAVHDIEVAYSGPDTPTSWRCTIDNTSGDSRAYEIWILCAE